jgi:hypothetical protein
MLTSQDTRFDKPIKSGEKKYWYEIELNDKDTLMGWDKDGAKVLVLWPEAVKAEESAGE